LGHTDTGLDLKNGKVSTAARDVNSRVGAKGNCRKKKQLFAKIGGRRGKQEPHGDAKKESREICVPHQQALESLVEAPRGRARQGKKPPEPCAKGRGTDSAGWEIPVFQGRGMICGRKKAKKKTTGHRRGP